MLNVTEGKPIAVFTADNHLRPTTWDDHPTLRDDSYIGLQQVVDYAILTRLPLFLLGDLFNNTRPDPNSVNRLSLMMYQMAASGNDVYYVDGNHDRTDPSWIQVIPTVKPATQMFQLHGINFYGLHFTSTTLLPTALSEIPPGVNVLLSHQSWADIQGIGPVNGKFGDIPYGLVLLTGDYHVTGQWHGKAANGENVIAYSPGSTVTQNLGETADKYFGVLYDNMAVTWHKIETRDYISLTCNTQADADAAVLQIQTRTWRQPKRYPEIEKPILRIRYRDDIPGCNDRFTTAAGEQFHLFLEPKSVVSTIVVGNITDKDEGFASLRTAVEKLATSPQLRTDAIRVLDTNDLAAELLVMQSQFMDADKEITGDSDEVRSSGVVELLQP